MKLKFIPMLVGTLGLTAGLAGVIPLSATPNSVMAQQPSSSQQPLTNPTAKPKTPPLPGLAGIDLTPQQQEQIMGVVRDLQAQMETTVPRPPQLTAEQQAKIQQVVQNYRNRVEAVLTPEQREQLRQNRNNQNTKPAPDSSAAPTQPPALARLNLTPQQQQQITRINEEMGAQFRAALPTPPELTAEQRAKLEQLRQAYRDRVEAILKPQQQQQFRQNLEQFRQNPANSSPKK